MITKILAAEIQSYISTNLKTDLHSLLLKKSPFSEISIQEIVQQIKGKNVAKKKFPFLLKENIIFPPNLNLEQTSSQSTALFKAEKLGGKSFIDLTSGFGIDAYFLSENFDKITLVEQNTKLLNIVKHNWKILGKRANFINENLEDFLLNNRENYDLVYLDPARRDAGKNKKFLLEDLSPNLLEIQDQLHKISNHIVIKLSPLIDISYLISALKFICKIEIIAVKNEVKELVAYISPGTLIKKVQISCINLESGDATFNFTFKEEKVPSVSYSEPKHFLYIPNNAILKSGAFNSISDSFQIDKLHPNTHFYTADHRLINFPGRIFEVLIIQSKEIKKGEKYNIISKNYPLTPDEIKKKYKILDGGNEYLVFTQTKKGKIILKSCE